MVGFDPKTAGQLSPVQYVFAGCISGSLTRAIVQPFDVIKIRFQLQIEPIQSGSFSKYHGVLHGLRSIIKEEGCRALWKGHVPAQVLSIVYGGTQFVSFEWLTSQMAAHFPSSTESPLRPFMHLFCGGSAGFVATVAAQPFDVLRTRFIAQGNKSVKRHLIYQDIVGASKIMLRSEGFFSLYKGLLPTLMQIVPQNGLQFGFYSLFSSTWKTLVQENNEQISGIGSLLSGSAAGTCAKAITHPFDMLKKRLQIQGFQRARVGFGKNETYDGLVHCFRTVIRKEGMLALYKGLCPSLIKAIMSVGLHFYFYEQCCQIFLRSDFWS